MIRIHIPGRNFRNVFRMVCVCMAAAVFCWLNPADATSDKYSHVYIIPVQGDVEPGMAAFIDRSLRQPIDREDTLYVLKMDTFGGRVDSAFAIVDSLLESRKGKTIAFVENKAISAGALIALACNRLVMAPNTTIGDCAPIMYSDEGPKMLGEKFQSPLRAKFRTLAKRNGYPERLAESMVTEDMEVFRVELDGKILYMDSHEFDDLTEDEKKRITSKKTLVEKGELLTMDDTEAHELEFSEMSARTIDEMLEKMGIETPQVIHIRQTWSESMVRTITSIAPILMIIGLTALYIELKAPGFGAPGIVGLVCLGLVFFNQYLVGLADHTELLIIVLGLVFLGLEVFVLPGFGVAGVAGMICITVGMILSLQDFVVPNPDFPWQKDLLIQNITQVVGTFMASILLGLVFLRYAIPNLPSTFNGPYLRTDLANYHADSSEILTAKVGEQGLAMTFLRPSGKMKMGNDILDVVSEGDYLEKGTPIVISEIRGNRIIVKPHNIQLLLEKDRSA